MMSPTDLEGWVNKGMIPKDLYDSTVQAELKMTEIRKRLQNGEQVPISELPPKPWELIEYLLKHKAILYEENVLTNVFSALEENDPDIVWLSFIKEAFSSITEATDPLTIHFHAARRILKEKYEINDSRAVDILARELLEQCRKISKFKALQHPAFNKNPIDLEDLQDHLKHENKQMLQLDDEFINYLKGIGQKGKKLASQIEKNSAELFKFYEENNYSSACRRKLWGLWVPENDTINHVLSFLAQALWEDQCFKLWYRETNGASSIVKPIIERIIPLLGPKKSKRFVEKDGNIILCGIDGEPLLMAPAVDVNMIAPFKKGVKELGTLTGHKMLRWQVNSGFERWVKGENDPRLIEIDGGYSRIADLIGCRHPSEIAKVRDILHAQAHGFFKFADGSHGNMIILNILNTYRNSEPSKIRIILGDMLLPTYVHQIERSERRLIPIGDIPPLSGGSPDTYAAQAQLQLLVFCEFSNQSIRLAQRGSVLLPMEWWGEKALEAGLNPEKIASIIEHWCQPDFFNCFLEREGDEYRLANYYTRQQKFLENQGLGRIKNSEKGKKSAEKRSGKIKKNIKVT
jgi:hypothetical protein